MLSMPTPDLNVRASIQEPRNGSSPTILTRMNRPTPTVWQKIKGTKIGMIGK